MNPVDKLLSGRYFATVCIILTYCGMMIGVVAMVLMDKLQVEAFLGLFAAFALLAREITQSYFQRTDRKGDSHD
jgi:hypothetical protein